MILFNGSAAVDLEAFDTSIRRVSTLTGVEKLPNFHYELFDGEFFIKAPTASRRGAATEGASRRLDS